jgi:lysophospholipase L1-like esterase
VPRHIFHVKTISPILRIAALLGVTLSSLNCDNSTSDGNPAGPSRPPAPGASISYTAIGASDAIGFGSSVVCVPFTDCPNGMGYVQVATRQLMARGFTVTLMNLGIPTAVIGPGFQALGQRYGRAIAGNFIDNEAPFVRTSDIVTIFAGVNDVNTITAALGGGAGGSDPVAYVDAQVRAFGVDYTTLIAAIRSRAGSPRLVIINVPNAGAMPFLANAPLAQRQAAQRASVAMSRTVVNPLASSTVAVVDLLCDPRSYQPAFYSSDGLHPNDGGYANIAAEVVRAMTATSYPAPQASCTSMTLVP